MIKARKCSHMNPKRVGVMIVQSARNNILIQRKQRACLTKQKSPNSIIPEFLTKSLEDYREKQSA